MKQTKTKQILIQCIACIAALAVVVLITACVSAFVCSRHIKATQYDVAMDGIQNPARIVVVADLHGKVYGEENQPLYDLVAAQAPDAIVLLGDLFPSDFDASDADYVVDFTQSMQHIVQADYFFPAYLYMT